MLNKKLADFARKDIKKGLKSCTEAQVQLFKNIFARRSKEQDIDDVVDSMVTTQLVEAMDLVDRTLVKNKKKKGSEV